MWCGEMRITQVLGCIGVLFAGLGSGCSFAVPTTSRLVVTLPGMGDGSAGRASRFLERPESTTFLTGVSAPQVPTDFQCFGINVTGPGIIPYSQLSDWNCNTPDYPSAGLLGGLLSSSQSSIVLDVPIGASRLIQLFGVQSTAGCPSIASLRQSNSQNNTLGDPYELGRVTTDVTQDTAVSISPTFDPSHPVDLFCRSQAGNVANLSLSSPNWSGGSGTVAAGQCFPIQVLLMDRFHNSAVATAPVTVSLSGNAAPYLFTESACSAVSGIPVSSGLASLTVPAGVYMMGLYFRSTLSSITYSLTGTASGLGSSTLSWTQ